jgi:hypothetical protein
MVKILEQPDNQRLAMMDGWYERQSLGSSAGVCNGAGEPGTASAERVPGGGEPNSAGAAWLQTRLQNAVLGHQVLVLQQEFLVD